MIPINSGKLIIPEDERFIGFAGDNLHSHKQFTVNNVADPDCIYRLYLKFDDGSVNYFVLDSKVENGSTILDWNILEEHIFKSGIVAAQIKSISGNGKAYHTTWDYFFAGDSAEFSGEFKDNINAEFLKYEKVLNEIYSKINGTDFESFVSKTRSIAGIDLSADITAEQLQHSLNTYPFKIFKSVPNESVVGKTGQLGAVVVYDAVSRSYSVHMYLCCHSDDNNKVYNWTLISNNSVTEAQIASIIAEYLEEHPVIGKDGENGASAYQIALDNGFEGTEQEWLLSLKGEAGHNGEDGEDGISPTITTSQITGGTRLNIQNGENDGSYVVTILNGKDGADGVDGQNGKDGYTPIKGKDYFDGEKGEKGENGKDGKTPVKGVDYFTDADKSELVSQVITALQTPVFGRVDNDNNIILSGSLAEGEYTLKYENEEGAVTEICKLTISENEPTYVNYATPSSADWLVNKRLNSSGSAVNTDVYSNGGAVTNFIPCKTGDVIRVKGLDISRYYADANGTTGRTTAFFYADDKSTIIAKNIPADGNGWVYENNIWTYTVGTSLTAVSGDNSSIRYCRLTGLYYNNCTAEDVVITVNQEIN